MSVAISQVELPTLSLFSPEFKADPYSAYAEGRRQHWIAECEFGFVVLSKEAVGDLLRDRRAVTAPAMVAQMMGAAESPWGRWVSTMLLGTDGEAHARLRKLVAPTFSLRRADASRPMINGVLTDILAPHLPRGRFDLMADICHEFPIRVLCNLIGVDAKDVPQFVDWVDTLGRGYDLNPALLPELDAALVGMWDYVTRLVEDRPTEGRDPDLVDELLAARDGADRLSHDELLTMIILLLGAGADTTKYQIGNLMFGLLSEAGQWARLEADPSLIPAAVEESLRYRAAVGTTTRLVTEDIDYLGLTIPAGSFLMLAIASAGHDAAGDGPATFDLGRTGVNHLAFGLGPHFCLGSHLARAELAVFLEVMLEKVTGPGLAGPVVWNTPVGVGGPSSLPLRFTARIPIDQEG